MGLTKYKLGNLICLCDERNSALEYTLDDVKGISIQKVFIETKSPSSKFTFIFSNLKGVFPVFEI